MSVTPLDVASFAMATPVGPSNGSMIRTLAPWLMSAVASLSSVASLPWALSMRYWLLEYPAASKACFRSGASKSTYRVEDVVSGRITPTCREFFPFVADAVNALNADIVDAMSLVKELTLMAGTLTFPPDELEPLEDLLQAAAIKMTTPTPTASRVDLCLLDSIAPPFLGPWEQSRSGPGH